MLGVGMIVALIFDATVARMLLVPATCGCSARPAGGAQAAAPLLRRDRHPARQQTTRNARKELQK
jgi:uncharacterized membrane protein YdfJ with MMPL/SSD domain